MSIAITENQDNIAAARTAPSCSQRALGAVGGTAGSALLGGLTAVVISFNPVGGLVFGAANAIAHHALSFAADSSGLTQSAVGKVAVTGLSWILGALAGYGATMAVGIPITFTTAAILTVAPIAVAAAVVLVGLVCLAGCAGLGVATGALSTDQLSEWRDLAMGFLTGETTTSAEPEVIELN